MTRLPANICMVYIPFHGLFCFKDCYYVCVGRRGNNVGRVSCYTIVWGQGRDVLLCVGQVLPLYQRYQAFSVTRRNPEYRKCWLQEKEIDWKTTIWPNNPPTYSSSLHSIPMEWTIQPTSMDRKPYHCNYYWLITQPVSPTYRSC